MMSYGASATHFIKGSAPPTFVFDVIFLQSYAYTFLTAAQASGSGSI